MTADELVAVLAPVPLLPVLRLRSAGEAAAMAARLAGAGLRAIELTATTPGWDTALIAARSNHPDVAIGLGTITSADDARRALDSGAQFLVSPYPVPEVRPVARAAGVAFVEGGFTPAEVADAASRGAAKLFPAHVGGPSYLRSILTVMPGARVIPTGGIRLAEVGEWLAAGAVAVGVGSDLTAPGDVVARVAEALAGAAPAPSP